jgi:DHA1 family tetracycline resistance protein-like MFS transporter
MTTFPTDTIPQREPAGKGALLPLFLVVFVSMTGFGLLIPIGPYFGLHLGASATEITYAFGAYSVGQLVAAPFWGQLSDRIGRRPVLILTLALTALLYLVLAQAQTILDVGLARLLAGVAAGNIGAALAAAADISTPQTRAKSMGVLGAGFGLGFIIGPAIGGLAAGADPQQADFARVCYYAAALAGVAAVVAFWRLKETRPADLPPRPKGSTATLLSRPALVLMLAITLAMITAQALMEQVFALWSNITLSWGPQEVGLTFAAVGVIAAGLQGGATGHLTKRFGEKRLLASGLVLFIAGLVGLALAQSGLAAIAALTIMAIGSGLSGPALQSLVSYQADDDQRGSVQGLQQSASALGRVIGPLAAGPMFDGLGHTAAFWIGALLLTAALAMVTTIKQARR